MSGLVQASLLRPDTHALCSKTLLAVWHVLTRTAPRFPAMQALANYAFGMGTLQMVLCTLAFTVLGLPPGHALFSQASTAAVSQLPGRPLAGS